MENKEFEKVKLTEEQKGLVSELKTLMEKLSDNGIEIIYNPDGCEFFAINTNNIKDAFWELDYLVPNDVMAKSSIIDAWGLEDYGEKTTLDQYIVVPRWDDLLVVKEWKED